MHISTNADVLVVGAGPVGLITAFQLAKFGGVSVRIIEKHVKSMQDAYGRAITLFPRTSEMLDQLGLADDLLQQCFACRDTVTYNSKGEEVPGRGWSFINEMKDTAFDFALVLRQKYQEEVFRERLKAYGVVVEAPVELVGIEFDHEVCPGDFRVTATLNNGQTGREETVSCKYLIGSDGGRSSVRRICGIPFEGSSSEDKWVRIDGKVKTNLPKPRTYCSIESPTHGNVLWVGLDHGATRIGYAFTDDRASAYAEFDEAAAVKEAIAACRPFDLEFETVDWWTIYTVGQRIVKNFFVDDCIFLAGDACHTHSSGAAQGMNTGIHDAVNLAWKLSLVLRGMATPTLLQTYQMERLPNVQRLIQYDKDISRLMTHRLPENWDGDPNANVNEVLGRIMAKSGSFNTGLGIFYDVRSDSIVSVEGSFVSERVKPGHRAPDVKLLRPGTFEETRLIRETPNLGRFYLVVLAPDRSLSSFSAGNASILASFESSVNLMALVKKGTMILDFTQVAASTLTDLRIGFIDFLIILPHKSPSPFDVLGHKPLGRVFFDSPEGGMYSRYDISNNGAIIVLRPDGWIGTMISLDEEAVGYLESYLGRVFSKLSD